MGSGNGLSPVRRQGITWTNGDSLSIGPVGININEMLIENLFIEEDAFRNVVCEMAAILSRSQYVNLDGPMVNISAMQAQPHRWNVTNVLLEMTTWQDRHQNDIQHRCRVMKIKWVQGVFHYTWRDLKMNLRRILFSRVYVSFHTTCEFTTWRKCVFGARQVLWNTHQIRGHGWQSKEMLLKRAENEADIKLISTLN